MHRYTCAKQKSVTLQRSRQRRLLNIRTNWWTLLIFHWALCLIHGDRPCTARFEPGSSHTAVELAKVRDRRAGLPDRFARPGNKAGKESRQPTAMNVNHLTSYWRHYCVITCKNGRNKTGSAERLSSPSAAKRMLVHFRGHKFVPWLQNDE